VKIFVSASCPTTPYDDSCRSSLLLFNVGGLDASGDISGCHLQQESLSDRIAKYSLFSVRAVLQLDLQSFESIEPLFFILNSDQLTTINQYHLLPKCTVGFLNINS